MNCPLCETPLMSRADDYYFICDTCGAYVKDKNFYVTDEQEKSRYEEHQNDVNDKRYQNFVAPIVDAILSTYSPTNLGLDYGCGTGPVVSKLLNDKGYQVKLYDPYFYPDNEYLDYQYDYIVCCEVVEHFHQPKQEIEKLTGLLTSNGRLYIMTHLYNPNIHFKNWYYRNDLTHVFIYTAQTIQLIAHKYKFTIERQDDRLIILKKAAPEGSGK